MTEEYLIDPELVNIAIRACKIGGRVLSDGLSSPMILSDKGIRDVQATTDLESEQAMVAFIKEAYPAHTFLTEETDRELSPSEHLWVIDPLDGTNNYVLGIPYFGVSLAFFLHGELNLACVYDPILRELYYARANMDGLWSNKGMRKIIHRNVPALPTVGLVTDYSDESDFVLNLERRLSRSCKRVTKMWAPAMDLARIADGVLDGLIAYKSDILDKCAGIYLVEKAGGTVTDFEAHPLKMTVALLGTRVSFIAAKNDAVYSLLLRELRSEMHSEGV